MLILSNVTPPSTVNDLTRFTGPELVNQYNKLAPLVGKAPVSRFSDRRAGATRLHKLFIEIHDKAPEALTNEVSEVEAEQPGTAAEVEAEQPGTAAEVEAEQPGTAAETKPKKVSKRKRQKVFIYPPLNEIKEAKPDSLRGRALELLKDGATFKQIEELCVQYDVEHGKTSDRIEGRAYGLIRLLHTYCGYGLREKGEGEDKLIFAITQADLPKWNG